MGSLEQIFREAAEAMARPAGRKPEFASLEEIAKHREAFVRACHETWRVWHERAIEQILEIDEFLRRNKAQPIGADGTEFGQYMCALWRKVNDSIVWTIFGADRWVVKRLCLYRPRTYLAENNAASVLKLLAALTANPMSFALRNDATSVVDLMLCRGGCGRDNEPDAVVDGRGDREGDVASPISAARRPRRLRARPVCRRSE